MHQQWLEKANDYICIKDALDTPFTKATYSQQSWQRYNAWLQEQVNQRMFDEVFGINQIYIPLRAAFYFKENVINDELDESLKKETKQKGTVVDLTQDLTQWIAKFNKDDAIRVISGGPGSGKSTFSKFFAAHITNCTDIRVLFIPLHHFDPSADLIEADKAYHIFTNEKGLTA